MTVYVDDMRLPARVGRLDGRWSHLTADTAEELHAFAERLGLKRAWYQERSRPGASHYDVTDGKREEAIRLGAVPETMEEGAARRRRLAADQRGQVLIWMMAMVLLVGFLAGWSIDLWRVVSADRQVTGLADGAAAAGANGIDEAAYRADRTIRLDPARARQLAEENLAAQPEAADLTLVDIAVDADSITVTLERPVPFAILQVLSALDDQIVHASARATPRRSP